MTGNTECIQNPSLGTIDYQQIQGDDEELFGEGVAMEVTVEESQMEGFLEPKISFTDVAKYSRFRYESERSKGTKPGKNKMTDPTDDYKSLGTVKVQYLHIAPESIGW